MKRNKEEIIKEYNEIALDLCKKHGILREQDKQIKMEPGFISLANSYYQCHDAATALAKAIKMYAPHISGDEGGFMLSFVSALQIAAGIPKENFLNITSADPTVIARNEREMDKAIQEMRKHA